MSLLFSPVPEQKCLITRIAVVFSCLLFVFFSAVCRGDDSDDWYLVSFNGKPVGYERLKVSRDHTNSDGLLTCHRRTNIRLKRLAQGLTVKASLWTKQASTGELLYFRLHRVDGRGERTERTGTFDAARNRFRITERVAATRRDYGLRVSSPPMSPLTELWLPVALNRATAGRTYPVLFPESADVARVTVSGWKTRTIRLSQARSVPTREVSYAPQLDPSKRTTLNFDTTTDQLVGGHQTLLAGKLTREISTAEQALTSVSGSGLDLDVLAPIPVSRALRPAPNGQSVTLDLTTTDGVIPDVPETPFQRVQRINSSTVRLTLTPADLTSVNLQVTKVSGSVRAIQDSLWMPLNDPGLIRMATTASAGATDPAVICQRLEAFVRSQLKYAAFSTALTPASQVAKVLRGDCTEHAILLAALLRIEGVPARVASGLVHTRNNFGFVGHAWVEALVGQRWVPFDSTQAAGDTAIHIKLADSPLSDDSVSGISLFLPVLDLAGQAQVTVISDN